MGTMQQIHNWSLTHHPRWLVVPRVALGLCLLIKGISFMMGSIRLEQILQNTTFAPNSDALILGITWIHFLGGVMIIIGLFTRWAVLLQLPILMAAIMLMLGNSIYPTGSDLPFTIFIFLLLVLFLVEGGGPLSLDSHFRSNPQH